MAINLSGVESVSQKLRSLNQIPGTYPPVLVPPIRSKYSQGLGGISWFILLIRLSRMSRVASPRTPPPSKVLVSTYIRGENRT